MGASHWEAPGRLRTDLSPSAKEYDLAEGFASPPHSARPWVYWFWINGNISKEGITADLEALKKAGVGGSTVDGSERAMVGAGR